MKIKKKILTEPITIVGRNVWGFKSYITFTPCNKPGWHFYNPVTKKDIPIDRHHVQCSKMSNLFIRYWRAEMHILEHLLSLRWFGLDGICISGSTYPPYWSALEYLNYLEEHGVLAESDEYMKSFPITEEYAYSRPHTYFQKPRVVILSPSGTPHTEEEFIDMMISVYIDYKEIGTSFKSYRSIDSFRSVLGTYPQGYPLYRYNLCKILSGFGWPHFGKVVWSQNQASDITLKEFSDHRAADILGDLAMISSLGLPSNFIFDSSLGGHLFDLNTTKQYRSPIY